MLKKLFSSESQSITGAALLLGAASFLSRIIGVFRDRILASQFGASTELDIYTAAFRIPDFLYNIVIVGALSAGFIPIFLSIYQKEKNKAWEFTNRVLTFTFLSLSLVSIIAFFVLPSTIQFLIPGFSPEAQKQTLMMTRIMLLSPLFLGLSAVVSSVLQSLRSFFVYSLTPIFYNAGIIFGALFLVPSYGLNGLAYGVVIGAFLHFCIQLPALFHSGFHFAPLWQGQKKGSHFFDTHMRQLLKLMIPRTLTLGTVQLSTLITTFFASTLASGSIAVFTFATNIASLPIGIIGISFALAAFPTLSELATKNKKEEFANHLSTTTKQILFFTLPLTVIFILLRAHIVRVLLGTGEFNWDNTRDTASTVGMFCIALFAQCLIPLYTRAFYAFHDTKTPFLRASVSLVLTAIFSFVLKQYLGVAGLALGISLAALIELVLLVVSLKKFVFKIDGHIVRSTCKMILATIMMGITLQMLKVPLANLLETNTFIGIFLQGLISGLIGIFVYVVFCLFFKLEEATLLYQSLQKKWLRLKNIPSQAGQIDEIK